MRKLHVSIAHQDVLGKFFPAGDRAIQQEIFSVPLNCIQKFVKNIKKCGNFKCESLNIFLWRIFQASLKREEI